LISINEVNLRRVQLVLARVWVQFLVRDIYLGMHYATSHPGQLSLAIPSWVSAMSTSQRAVMPRGWEVKAGVVRVLVAGI